MKENKKFDLNNSLEQTLNKNQNKNLESLKKIEEALLDIHSFLKEIIE